MKIFIALFMTVTASFVFGQAGSVDTTFNLNANVIEYIGAQCGPDNSVNEVLRLPDGKMILIGEFYTYNGEDIRRIVRIHADGSIDQTFNAGDGANAAIRTIVLQPNGKLLIAGSFYDYDNVSVSRIARLNADGSLDQSFLPIVNGDVASIVVTNDNKILIGGSFTSCNGINTNRIARLNSDGTTDTTFQTGTGFTSTLYSLAVQPDQKILAVGDFWSYNGTFQKYLIRLNVDGSIDSTFQTGTGPNGMLNRMKWLSIGKIAIAGHFTDYNGISRTNLVVINVDGSLDTNFNSGTGPTGGSAASGGNLQNVANVFCIEERIDGKILIVGGFTSYNGMPMNKIALLNSDGTADDSFFDPVNSAGYEIRSVLINNDQSMYVVGRFASIDLTWRSYLAKLNQNGEPDSTFLPQSGTNGSVRIIKTLSDGSMLAAGSFYLYNGVQKSGIVRLTNNGDIDAAFNASVGGTIEDVNVQTDGKLIISGGFTSLNGVSANRITRLHFNGDMDTTFDPGTAVQGSNLMIHKTVTAPDGRILVAGNFYSFNGEPAYKICRLFSNGSVDPSFHLDAAILPADGNPIFTVAALANEKIIVGGYFGFKLLNSDGSLDTAWNAPPFFVADVHDIVHLSDGKVLIGSAQGVIRVLPDGAMDTTFVLYACSEVRDIEVQPDGRILAMSFDKIYRLLPNGLLDTTFHMLPNQFTGPIYGEPYAAGLETISLQQSGKILAGGNFTRFDNEMYNGILRLHNTGLSIFIDSSSNIGCLNDGYIAVQGTFGVPPYQYNWQTTPQVSGQLLAVYNSGIYSCTMYDAIGDSTVFAFFVAGPGTFSDYDLNTNLHASAFRPGFTSTTWLDAFNDGCIPVSGQLKLAFDPLLDFVSADPVPSSVTGDTLVWDFPNMFYDAPHLTPQIVFTTSSVAVIGDTIRFTAVVTPVSGDADSTNNTKSYAFPVVNGYDPNIKSVYPLGKCDVGYIEPDQTLTYTVQFQNSGNSEAINIAVVDSLDVDLDLNTVRVVGNSHEMWTEVLPGNVLKFHFDNIHLADSTSNEPASHGYVMFEVKPVTSWLNHNTEIVNKADIFFDFNPSITTNEVSNLIYQGDDLETFNCFEAGIDEMSSDNLMIYPNPTTGAITVLFQQEIQDAVIVVVDLQGKEVARKAVTYASAITLDLSTVEAGVYLLSVQDQNGKIIERNRKISKTNG